MGLRGACASAERCGTSAHANRENGIEGGFTHLLASRQEHQGAVYDRGGSNGDGDRAAVLSPGDDGVLYACIRGRKGRLSPGTRWRRMSWAR